VLNDLRFALRSLRKAPGFTTVAVLTLALGIGATSAMFSLVNGILLRPLPYAQPGRLVQVRQAYPEIGLDNWALSHENVVMYRDRVHAFASFAGYHGGGATLVQDGQPRRLSVVRATGDFFTVLGVGPTIGRTFGRAEDTPRPQDVAVLSYGLWQSAFGGRASVLGAAIDLDGRPTTVIGVMPPGFAFPGPDAQVYLPLGLDPTRRFGWFMTGIARLAPGATLDAARRAARAVMWDWAATMPSLVPHAVNPRTTHMTPLVERLHDAVVGQTRRPLQVLQAAVVLILLIAVANIAMLLSSRAARRSRELALRNALGATGWRITRQLLTESVVLAVLGGGAGVALAVGLVDVITHARAVALPRLDEVAVNWQVLAFTLGVSVAAGLAFGAAPTIALRRARVTERLADAQRGSVGGSARRLNGALVMAQLALALILLISAGLVLQSFRKLTDTPLGFQPAGVTTLALPLPVAKYTNDTLVVAATGEIVDRVRAVPGVSSAAMSGTLPLGGRYNTDGYLVEGHAPPAATGMETQTVQIGVGPGYFHTLQIPLLYGRDFDDRDRAGSLPVTIVDEALAARYWHGAEALGHRMRLTGDATWQTIVGVVGSVRDADAAELPIPHSYFPFAQAPDLRPMLSVRTDVAPGPVIAAVKQAIAGVEPGVPLDNVRSLADWAGQSLDARRVTKVLLAGFALLAALLASVGIYGVMSLYVADRYREFGVRLAIGAEPRGLVRMVLGQGLALAGMGVGFGVIGALVATRWLRALLYEVSPTDPFVYATLAGALLALAAASVYLPARRAARSDPLITLRTE
jgi:putative ABC transport system permease protein